MSCGGGHLGFPIGIKTKLGKGHPMIIHLQFEFSQFISQLLRDKYNQNYVLDEHEKAFFVHLDQRSM
jgi:hypothetical protein